MGCCISTPAESKSSDARILAKSKSNQSDKGFVRGVSASGDGVISSNSGKFRLNVDRISKQRSQHENDKKYAKSPTDEQNQADANDTHKKTSPKDDNQKTTMADMRSRPTDKLDHDGSTSKQHVSSREIDSPSGLPHRKSRSDKTLLRIGPEMFVSLKTGVLEDNYKLGQTVGEGAFGKVMLATHRTTGITRAMKSIKKKLVKKTDEEKLFAEVSILRELDHPNILKLYELFQDNQNYYLITEYLNGGELFDRIQQMTCFTEKQAAEYMKQLLSAVVYLHERHIVHRDLKPENLLLDSKKPDAALKLIDFGTATKFEPGHKLTQKYGTPYYIAPEVLAKNYNEKCDVWSCGIIMYILLSGYPPFNGKNDAEILANIKIGKFTFDESDWGRISPEAKTLIQKMLTYDHTKRISASEALNDEWVMKNRKPTPLNKKVMDNLSSFQAQNKLKQAIMTFIVTQISSQHEKEELQKAFQELDKDGNGILSRDELMQGYIKVFGNKEKAEEEVSKILAEVDANGSGEIDFSEFIMATMNNESLLSKQRINQAFAIFDQNGDGFITRDELAAVMGGVDLQEDEWNQIIEEVDTNKDGKISQEEFIQLLHHSANVINKEKA